MRNQPLSTFSFPLFFLTIACCGLIACQTPYGQTLPQKKLTYHYTGWPEKSVKRLLFQYLDSKNFLVSESREGTMRFDRKGSHWDTVKYGSFLEPSVWLRLEPTFNEDKESMQTTLSIKVSLITHRLSSLEEEKAPGKHHMEEANKILGYFERMMLPSVSSDTPPPTS
jgi:hypothetical protein